MIDEIEDWQDNYPSVVQLKLKDIKGRGKSFKDLANSSFEIGTCNAQINDNTDLTEILKDFRYNIAKVYQDSPMLAVRTICIDKNCFFDGREGTTSAEFENAELEDRIENPEIFFQHNAGIDVRMLSRFENFRPVESLPNLGVAPLEELL